MPNNLITISNQKIGEGNPVYFIAEIGLNHNGSLTNAKKLVDAAFACGWHCVKFQKRTPEICVPEQQKHVMRDTPWGRMSYLEYRYKVEFEHDEYRYIDRYCREKPIQWSASVWDVPSVEFLLEYDVPFIKIPSAKLTETDILVAAARSGKTIFLSTGMSTLDEIDSAVETIEKHASSNYLLMHTNSSYPAPPEELNLNVIPFLKERYGCIVGYSGHESGLEPSVVAAVLGAKVIERHVTLDHNMWGSDHFASLEIEGMHKLIRRVAEVADIMGSGVKTVTESELEIRKKLRGVAAR
jgi:N-acetylneuraminate synthase